MSTSKLSRCLPSFFSRTGVNARYVHRAPDRKYLPLWERYGHDFMQSMGAYDQSKASTAGKNMYQSPLLVEKILQVFVAMKERDLVPFLHAMPASAKVLMKAAEVIYPFDPNLELPFKYLRFPQKAANSRYEEVIKTIPKEERRFSKPQLLSLSYALTSGIRHLESAASWGFVNHFGKEQYFPMMHRFQQIMKESGVEENSKAFMLLSKCGSQLIRKYNRLSIGDFFIIGIPKEKVEQFVYDSKPFNIPTGKKVLDIVINPKNHAETMIENKTHMGTMLICDETLDPKSGLCIVNSSDSKEVASFCDGMRFKRMLEVQEYRELCSSSETEFESMQIHTRGVLDKELDQFIDDFKECRVDPLKALSIQLYKFEEADPCLDFPETMP